MLRTKKIPQRMCVGCREKKNKRELIRIVRTPEGSVLIDKTGKKSGRGAYICNDSQCLSKAVKSKSLEKALNTTISAEIPELLQRELGELC
ncbi:MAG: RNase P modulator RnpM [Bacillota bacterium]